MFALTIGAGIDPIAAVVLSGLIAAVFAVPTAFVVFRLRGPYFAIGRGRCRGVSACVRTIQAARRRHHHVAATVGHQRDYRHRMGQGDARGALTGRARHHYLMALALAAGTPLLVYLVLRSRYGLALFAIRDSEATDESAGVDGFRTKLGVYVLVAAATGMIGALIYLQKARISPDAAFSVLDWTAYVIFIVVIGGVGTIEGPIVGVIVFYALQRYLADFGTWYLILLGTLAIVIMLFAPKGIWGYVAQRYGVALFPVRRMLARPHE